MYICHDSVFFTGKEDTILFLFHFVGKAVFLLRGLKWNWFCKAKSQRYCFILKWNYLYNTEILTKKPNSMTHTHTHTGWGPRGVMIKVLNCGIVVSEFELPSRYNVHFWTHTFVFQSMNPLIILAMGQMVLILLSQKNVFGII